MFDFLDHLDPEQRTAATSDGAALLIVAGAGTGKTTALTGRVAWLLAGGVPAERTLLLTFTRRAASDILARTDAMLTESQSRAGGRRASAAGKVCGGTFHAVAHRTLRRHAAALGLPDGFGLLDQSDAADLVGLVRDEQRVAGPAGRFPQAATILDLYSRAVNTGRPLSDAVTEAAPWCMPLLDQIAAVCRGYVTRKRDAGVLDFDDLLLYWRAAVTDDRLGPRLASDYDHVLVDEYQDVNAVQVDIVRALRVDDPRVSVVGDDAQAVHGFRAASAQHLLDFPKHFPGSRVVTLVRNYRSTQQILDAANVVASRFTERFHKTLVAMRPPGERPELVSCHDELGQTAAVCERVLDHLESGLRLRDQAVLMRTAHHSDALEIELSRRRIPYRKYGGIRFLEAAHVKDLLAAFRLADNPYDELAWSRLLQRLDGVGPATTRRVTAALGVPVPTDGVRPPDSEVWDRWAAAADLLPTSVRPVAHALVSALQPAPGQSVGAHADRIRTAIGPLVRAAFADAAARLADLDALVAAAAGAARLSEAATDVALDSPRSSSDLAGPPHLDDDYLVLSTVHSAKGLEWDVVHLLNATDGCIPSDMSLSTREGLEEERRLFYVALTRPRRRLHVYVPLRYHHRPRGRDDAHSYAQPSRFLDPEVRALFQDGPAPESMTAASPVVPAGDRVEVILDALWR